MTAGRIAGCRNCHADPALLQEVLDLGVQQLPDFPTDAEWAAELEETGGGPRAGWPLRLLRCTVCDLVQLDATVPRELLYHDRYGFYSGVNEAIRADLHDLVNHARRYVPDPATWLDVACNDGTLLSFVDPPTVRIGIDPVLKFRPLAERHADRIVTGYFPTASFADVTFDVITASSVFYDLDDPHHFLRAAAEHLEDKGILLVQQNSLGAMLEANAYDNVCHEHLTYWSATTFCRALERHGLEALDVRTSPINGGVFRVAAGHRGVRTPAPSVAAALYAERRRLPGRLGGFPAAVATLVQDLRDLVGSIVAEGARVMVYGASTRGGTIWQAAGLDRASTSVVRAIDADGNAWPVADHAAPPPRPVTTSIGYRPWLEAAVDRNPDKVGRRYVAAGGIPIISEQQMRADPPDYLLVGPWWLRDQIRQRERAFLEGGGRLVFPLPYVEVVSQ